MLIYLWPFSATFMFIYVEMLCFDCWNARRRVVILHLIWKFHKTNKVKYVIACASLHVELCGIVRRLLGS